MTALCGRSLLGHVGLIHNKSQPIVVVNAARTPCGKCRGQLAPLSAWQLGQMAVEAAVKRSAVPLEQVHHIFMNETQKLQREYENKSIFTHFLKKAKYTSISINENAEMDSFLMASEFVKSHPKAVAVAGGFVSTTNDQKIGNSLGSVQNEHIENYVRKSLVRYKKSQAEAVFDSEVVPLKVQKQRNQSRIIEEICHDEIVTEKSEDCNKTCQHCDGATAVILTSAVNAQELNLSPLALIKGIQYLHNTANILPRSVQCLDKLIAKVGIQPHQIKHWEIDDDLPQLVDHVEENFNINADLINPHGSSIILGHSPITSFTRLLTHICHALNPSEYGCVVSNSHRTSSALIVEKLFQSPVLPDRLPLVTLYTTNSCPLCDILLKELEHNFPGEYELEKVLIDSKENVRFLRLYRYDIPVVFLNNQFLCMHRLNHNLFRKRLNLLKNN